MGEKKNIKNLGYSHVYFNPVSERDRDVAKWYHGDDYKMTPFLQFT